MISNLDANSQIFLANLNRVERRLNEANAQVSSGRKLSSASDAPDEVVAIIQLRTDQQRNEQIESNLTLAKTNASAADAALAGAAQLMDTAVELAAQGANGTQTAATRQAMAEQVNSILQEMVAYSQTQVQGRYIFSGDQDQSPTYQVDLAALTGVDKLSSAAATGRIEDPAGGSFAASKTAGEIFDDSSADGSPAPDNVFAALNHLRTALLNNDQTGISNAAAELKQAAGHLNSMEAFYGSVENRIQDASTFASNYDTQLKAEISDKEDADVTASVLELTQATTQMQAAMAMQGKMPRSTLFDYLG